MQKHCGRCQVDKALELFNDNKWKKDGKQTVCRDCEKQRFKAYYASNIEIRKKAYEKSKISKAKRIYENYKFIFEYCKTHFCIDCNESEFVLLEFDHIKDKKMCIAKAAQRSTLEELKAEIEKCVVRCVSCHRRKTAKQLNWYKKYDFMGM